MDVSIAEKIRLARISAQLSQDEFAAMIGVSQQVVSNWENNVYLPNIENVAKIAQALNVNYEYFFGDLGDNVITERNVLLLLKYNRLDSYGRWIVDYNLNTQLTRIDYFQSHKESKDIILKPGDPDYNEMKEKSKDLYPLFKKIYKTYESLALDLWDMQDGYYRDKLNIYTINRILHGKKVPVRFLYEDIKSVLTRFDNPRK